MCLPPLEKALDFPTSPSPTSLLQLQQSQTFLTMFLGKYRIRERFTTTGQSYYLALLHAHTHAYVHVCARTHTCTCTYTFYLSLSLSRSLSRTRSLCSLLADVHASVWLACFILGAQPHLVTHLGRCLDPQLHERRQNSRVLL